MQPSLKTCSRRFGVELEYNAFDGVSRSRDENDLPLGIYEVGRKLQENLKKCVEITKIYNEYLRIRKLNLKENKSD